MHVLRQFSGAWILRRYIQPGGAHLYGDAVFAATGEDELAYRESGMLTLADGREFSAYRRYLYRLSGERIIVEFADGPEIGNPFLSLSFSRTVRGMEASDVHTCGNDTYHATYSILGPTAFDVMIKVHGPAKAYELISKYYRS